MSDNEYPVSSLGMMTMERLRKLLPLTHYTPSIFSRHPPVGLLEEILREIERLGWTWRLEGRYSDDWHGCQCWLADPTDHHGVVARVQATDLDITEAATQCLVKILERKPDAN